MHSFSRTVLSHAVFLFLGSLYMAASAQTVTDNLPILQSIEIRSATGVSSLQTLPTSATVVDGEQIHDRQMQVNLSESLSGVPGLQIKNRQNYAQDLQLSMRGYGARSTFGVRGVRLYVDSIPATMPDGQGSLSHIDIASIERIEVLRGPYSVLYGNSAGGVVSVFTETPEGKPFVEGGVNFGSDGQKRLAAKAGGQTAQGLSYLVSASRFMTDGYRDHSAADRNTANVKLSTAIGNDARLTITANTMKSDAQDPQGVSFTDWQNNPRGVSSGTLQYNTRKSLEQTQLGATYERKLSGMHSVALTAYAGHRSMEQYQSIPKATQQKNVRHAGGMIDMSRDYAGLDAHWTGKFTDAPVPVTVTAGLALDRVVEDRQGYYNFKGEQLGVRGALSRNEENTITNVDPYVQASWKLAPTWTLDTGLRYSHVKFEANDKFINADNPDDSGNASHHKALPVVSLSHALTPNDTAYISIGRGYETPTFAELSYRSKSEGGLNLALQPSVSDQVELGFRQRLTGSVKGMWSAAVFHSSTDNELISDSANSGDGRTVYRNAGKTRRMGAELQADVRLSPKWTVQAAYTYLDATFREQTGSAAKGNQLPGISKQNLFVAANYQITPEWRAGISAQHASKVFVNDANAEAAPSFTVAGASVGYTKDLGAWTLNAFARFDNLFDRKYVGSVIVGDSNGRFYESAPGRTWATGVNIRYNY
ncbi:MULTISPECIES: TonB-dependent receptor [unclassified Acidovorax]|jgi:iron complex outermembrane receptor protein|uniref:TonB-dependent receptor family protein n=1 Tax=unclassified Acidovorax TaxID=2684926 RepID=UPI0005DBB7DB|nr:MULTISPECIES: TonB-dependent receptor [unclassified Acidovorax]OZA56303.1 MAG: TonB-dependent siderophore receptor [Acidovorax sp. 17-64-282]GAO27535.1 TonB-dependent receptor [Alicycliphilus sp. B1]HQS65360.1 TonB-dependent receptor [Acidovorax defluvii]OYY25762.1 MAG: TonB-dependent siderophore receptor [Acidovorax sp. 35-64-16]OYZ42530.1 MAG: TonB-dependent siderophore receptor [Acidovorax sp. 16-64-162]